MSTNPGRRSRLRWRPSVIAALASGQTTDEAARIGKVSSRTVDRWRANPRFRTLVEEARGAVVSRAVGVAGELALGALGTLDEIRRNGEAPAAARVSACRVMLETLLKSREHQAFSDRLDALEATIQTRAGFAPGPLREVER